MKVAIVYNRDSKRVINLFGMPNQEKIGMKTIDRIAAGLRKGGHQVRAIEGDKDLVDNLEQFMPRVVKGELPGLVFNVSYGIQGQARYTHVPSILEMVGVPYVGSGPLAHSLALDKVVAKMIFQQNGVPTPEYNVMQTPDSDLPELPFPMIVKPKNEAVSFGLRVVKNEAELREGVTAIFDEFRQSVLVEQYVEGREINIGLLGNNPPETLPPVELLFGDTGPAIYTMEDKMRESGREISWECPPKLDPDVLETAKEIAQKAFSALGCYDCARVDMRLDGEGNLYVLEINSLPSMGEHGSYTIAAAEAGLDFGALVCRLVDVASARYFGTPSPPTMVKPTKNIGQRLTSYLVQRRDQIEKRLQAWTQVSSRTSDPTGLADSVRRLSKFCEEMALTPDPDLTDERAVWTWQSKAGLDKGILLVGHLDVPTPLSAPAVMFRRDPEWLYGEGIASSRAPLVCMQFALRALRSIRRLQNVPMALLYYTDEGRDYRYSHKIVENAVARAAKVLVLRPGNLESSVVTQRRGRRKYRFTVVGEPRRLGKVYRKRGVLRWTTFCLDEFAKLTSKESRVAVATGDLGTESYPESLPHRTTSTILVSFLDITKADAVETQMREIIKTKEFQCSLELLSDRPAMKRTKRNRQLFSELQAVADEWEIPLERESSLSPSVAGLVPSSKAVVCGLGPVARDVDTPQEAVLRLSLMQRTLLLAQYLSGQVRNKGK
ncbi:MAG: ATP-grasp domain-containing protein [candidate division Zixibacteria bacterium]|nr:ATP-grasp domain-containing protein [candidate division Zixibacteria bacterium]MDH3938119.1 ATP-grasp domain-containing protein [candidate division Zixibacteria bacterium]MDH4033509.1 ATP-grasp domain-containing protein [candidate division Zixibacteria bacterium]